MHKVLTLLLVAVVIAAIFAMPAQAAYVAGTASGSSLVVGGDGGSANQVDLAGDIVASYTSTAGNDTAFKTNLTPNATAVVSAVFGDTAQAVGGASSNIAPGGVINFTLSVRNFGNQSDVIKVKTDTPSVTGAAKDSVTIRVNGSVVYQNGNDSFLAVSLPALAAGAETQVTVQISHDTSGPLGNVDAIIKTIPNAGGGGETGGYMGNNGDSYAGIGNANVTYSVNVKSIKVNMLVEHDPIMTPASYNGPMNDTVPGSTITYVIRYDNDGNDTAVAFTLSTKIPANSVLASALDTTLIFSHTGATPTVTVTDSSGVSVADTNPLAERIKWTWNIGVAPNNGDNANTVDASVADMDAGYVKFKVYIK